MCHHILFFRLKGYVALFVLAGILPLGAQPTDRSFDILEYLPRYNVVWDSPSADSSGSMPLGGGGVGANVWVEKGDLLLYAQQSGAYDKNGEYLKMGRFRLRLEPNPFPPGAKLRQEFHVKEGRIEIGGELPGGGRVDIDVWIEATRPVVHLGLRSGQEVTMTAAYESWRFCDVSVPDDKPPGNSSKWRRSSIYDYHDYLPDVIKPADVIEPAAASLVWYQDNADRPNAFDFALEHEDLRHLEGRLWDPLQNLISGGRFECPGLRFVGTSDGEHAGIPFKAWTYRSERPAKRFDLRIVGQIGTFEKVDDWKVRLNAASSVPGDLAVLRAETAAWWAAFWQRSYVVINPGSSASDPAWRAGRNYQLVRHAFGGNIDGAAPTKFNGGSITFDPIHARDGYLYDPDYRRWGGWSYTAANQSLVYWPYLKSGDFDAMLPEFDLYRLALANSELRTRAHFGHEGCSFPEQVQASGFPVVSQYGFATDSVGQSLRSKAVPKGELASPWIIYFYHGQLEHAFMILEYHRFSGRDISPYLPFIVSAVKFYDQHYQMYHNLMTRLQMKANPLGPDGKLVIFPSTAGERYPGRNPAEVCAALKAITRAMLALPDTLLTAELRAYFAEFDQRVPALPTKKIEHDGKTLTIFTASEDDTPKGEGFLHSVYPYDLVVPGTPDFAVALNSMAHRVGGLFPGGLGLYSARVGDTKTAQGQALRILEDCVPRNGRAFPTFWITPDWGPDLNHGGRGVSTVQEMLMQTAGREIRLLPAWPKAWDVAFKLHAPHGTTVEAEVKGGKIHRLKVTPESRAKDVVILDPR